MQYIFFDTNIYRQLGVNFYFDDESFVLEKMPSVENRFLFDQFGIFQETEKFPRVLSWKDVKRAIGLYK